MCPGPPTRKSLLTLAHLPVLLLQTATREMLPPVSFRFASAQTLVSEAFEMKSFRGLPASGHPMPTSLSKLVIGHTHSYLDVKAHLPPSVAHGLLAGCRITLSFLTGVCSAAWVRLLWNYRVRPDSDMSFSLPVELGRAACASERASARRVSSVSVVPAAPGQVPPSELHSTMRGRAVKTQIALRGTDSPPRRAGRANPAFSAARTIRGLNDQVSRPSVATLECANR